ncbi:hypothetical protein [Anaerococcus tetradius]|uniref:Uncharacterized protein n=1 Tax=Anaerococcus tetradius TaxID=33036 RepID=A0A133KB20_9FIRM|nr:hypothetical protein [Anaerococcus tetradius]KWZ76697.1 hypothetical protein HMPREF3200_01650 [Anaerococcus tetradius]
MKKNNITKGIIALTLATSFVLGAGQSSFAAEATSISQKEDVNKAYLDAYNELNGTYTECLSLRDKDYTYINATSYCKAAFDGTMTEIANYINSIKAVTEAEKKAYIPKMKAKLEELKTARDRLDGKQVDSQTLTNLIDDARSFIRNDDNYKAASQDLKAAFDLALTNAYTVYGKGDSLSKGEYEKAVSDLRDTKAAILRYVKTEDTKKVLAKRIEEAEVLLKDKKKYSADSVKIFELALTAAKSTAANPKASLENYEDIIQKLDTAKEDMLGSDKDAKIKKALDKLKKAKSESEITVKACKTLLDFPAIAKNYGDKIRTYLVKAEKVIKNAEEVIAKYEKPANK